MYHLPAANVQINPDPKTYVSSYTYNNEQEFKPSEIIHIRDICSNSIYRGSSRLEAATRSMDILYKMQNFQDSFFENGAVPGIVLTTENTLSQVAKDKTLLRWKQDYSPKRGAKSPMILDSGLKPNPLLNASFQDMDFDNSIKAHDIKILKALGVPPILLDGGNNANISPNMRLFYLETVLPIVRKYISAIERYFGYDVDAITSNVSALQPELKDIATYNTTLVNGGIISPNEARTELRYDPKPGHDDLRIPANIAGSAADPSQGGAPKKEPTPSAGPPAPKPK
jgi:HK97 family phage portal protein